MGRARIDGKKIWELLGARGAKLFARAKHPINRRWVFFVAGALFCLAVGFWVGFILLNVNNTARPLRGVQTVGAAESATTSTPRALDGVLSATDPFIPLMAAVIDNHPDALPQSGLAAAGVVFDVPVEGGMTRLVALIPADAGLPRIGPIRSLRPYMLDIGAAFGAWIMHVGGSPEALALSRAAAGGSHAVNEFYNGEYFFREPSRPRPHNVFISNELFNRYLKDGAITGPQSFTPWIFSGEAGMDLRGVGRDIVLNFGAVKVKWVYDKENNVYTRLQNGVILREANGTMATAKNVVVHRAPARVLDEVGRLELTMTGAGEADVYMNGWTTLGKWARETSASPFRYMNGEGQEVAFVSGATWIEVVPVFE